MDYSDYFKNCDAKDKIMRYQDCHHLVQLIFLLLSLMTWIIAMLSSEENPRVLVNTFDALEFYALRILKHVTMVGIGPSIPSIFLDDNTFRADMIEISSKNYMDWLNSKIRDQLSTYHLVVTPKYQVN
ncbi:hypothetical protein H5410_004517 [Solanum commersonii]|uniref:Uncharacterized protein n=1 Tax=Solanum commersonii TaxID=4109 RepID=A0A9J6B7W6_SOLCO|nr:hypothetical protein H5410_004517 [Solanum commersonii]